MTEPVTDNNPWERVALTLARDRSAGSGSGLSPAAVTLRAVSVLDGQDYRLVLLDTTTMNGFLGRIRVFDPFHRGPACTHVSSPCLSPFSVLKIADLNVKALFG